MGFLVIEAAREAETLRMDRRALPTWYVAYSGEPQASWLSDTRVRERRRPDENQRSPAASMTMTDRC